MCRGLRAVLQLGTAEELPGGCCHVSRGPVPVVMLFLFLWRGGPSRLEAIVIEVQILLPTPQPHSSPLGSRLLPQGSQKTQAGRPFCMHLNLQLRDAWEIKGVCQRRQQRDPTPA